MREQALHADSPPIYLKQTAPSVGQWRHLSVAAARPKAARFQGSEPQCVLIPTAAASRVAGACVKQYTIGCLSHVHKARITAARLCGHSGPLFGEKKHQVAQPEEEATRRQRAISSARHWVAHCLTASSREALIRQTAQRSGVPQADLSTVNNDTLCSAGHTDDPSLETQPAADAPELCASSSISNVPRLSRRSFSSDNLPNATLPKEEAAQTSANIPEEELTQHSTSDERTLSEKQKWIESYQSLALQCSELSKELQCVSPKVVLPRWQRQALDLASYSAHVNFEAVRKQAAAAAGSQSQFREPPIRLRMTLAGICGDVFLDSSYADDGLDEDPHFRQHDE
ncbi:hypothetical protein Emed_003870 [Eimeria media]